MAALEPEERKVLVMGEALFAIRDTAGFRALRDYLDNLATIAAFKGINEDDDKQGVKFWRGYIECATQIVRDVDRAIEDAHALKAQMQETEGSFAGVRIGGGSLSEEDL